MYQGNKEYLVRPVPKRYINVVIFSLDSADAKYDISEVRNILLSEDEDMPFILFEGFYKGLKETSAMTDISYSICVEELCFSKKYNQDSIILVDDSEYAFRYNPALGLADTPRLGRFEEAVAGDEIGSSWSEINGDIFILKQPGG